MGQRFLQTAPFLQAEIVGAEVSSDRVGSLDFADDKGTKPNPGLI